MPIEITIRGAGEIARISAHLKAAGNGGLRRQMLRDIRQAARPMIAAAREAALRELPHEGGLNRIVAESNITTRTRTSGTNPGVRVIGVSSRSNLRRMDEFGQVRHPVFGNTEVWATTNVPVGWFTRAMQSEAPVARREIIRALNTVARGL